MLQVVAVLVTITCIIPLPNTEAIFTVILLVPLPLAIVPTDAGTVQLYVYGPPVNGVTE